ncbi:hypothetical protein CR51_21060 [Caballeronia megalochromosomata]|nr:hypothetical protein CR51_21060 [Caballeronia megalochromosomata]
MFIGTLPAHAQRVNADRKAWVEGKRYETWECGCGVRLNARLLNKNSAVARLTIIFPRRCAPGL